MLRRYDSTDLLLAWLLTVLTAAAVAAFPAWHSPLRILLGLVVILLAPGYVLTVALFPKQGDIDAVERLALTLGLSIAVVPLLGLLLNYTPWGIRLVPIALALAAFVTLVGLLGTLRRGALSAGERFAIPLTARTFRALLVVLGVLVLMGGVVALAGYLRPSEHFTEFYVLGKGGKLEEYPTTLHPAQPFLLTFGVTNHEGKALSYRLKFPFEGSQAGESTPLLQPGQTWQKTLHLIAPRGSGKTKFIFNLFRPADSAPYRSLHLFVTLAPATPPAKPTGAP